MQVPEKLSLMGGSILLASTLVFTLKSQASSILPKVNSGVSAVLHDNSSQSNSGSSHQQNQQQVEQNFNNSFQQAQKDGWETGSWGTAKFYVDNQGNMYVGNGQLQESLSKVINGKQIKTINFSGAVQAPQDSSWLLSGTDSIFSMNNSITAINGLDKLDTSRVSNMSGMFANDNKLTDLNVNNWNTSNVTTLDNAFNGLQSLQNLNVNNWDTHNVNSMFYTFYGDGSLNNLNLSNWREGNIVNVDHTFAQDSNLTNLNITNLNTSSAAKPYMFGGDFSHFDDNLSQLTLGSNTTLNNINYFPDTEWQQGNIKLSGTMLTDGNAHPGTWVKQ